MALGRQMGADPGLRPGSRGSRVTGGRGPPAPRDGAAVRRRPLAAPPGLGPRGCRPRPGPRPPAPAGRLPTSPPEGPTRSGGPAPAPGEAHRTEWRLFSAQISAAGGFSRSRFYVQGAGAGAAAFASLLLHGVGGAVSLTGGLRTPNACSLHRLPPHPSRRPGVETSSTHLCPPLLETRLGCRRVTSQVEDWVPALRGALSRPAPPQPPPPRRLSDAAGRFSFIV